MHLYDNINEASLSSVDRLGLAWCRLNSGEWDNIIGDKPSMFDSLPDSPRGWRRIFHRPTKSTYLLPAMAAINATIGEENISRCWWVFALGRTEAQWRDWYFSPKRISETLLSVWI